jgi:hypothetical protein
MMLRRMLEGALKCALRDLRLEDEMAAIKTLILELQESVENGDRILTCADLGHCD